MSETDRGRASLGAPARRPGLYVPIVCPIPDAPARLLLTGGPLVGAYCHWIRPWEGPYPRGRTVPCLVHADACEGCRLGRDRRWKGWLAAWMARVCRHVLAEITLDATRDVDPAVWRNIHEARGWELILTRKGACNNAPVRAAFLGGRHPAADLPSPCDVRAALARAWGMCPDFARTAVRWTALPPWMEETANAG